MTLDIIIMYAKAKNGIVKLFCDEDNETENSGTRDKTLEAPDGIS